MAEDEPGRVRQYFDKQRRKATEATKHAALKFVAKPAVILSEVTTATAAGLEVGDNFPVQRAVWAGIQEAAATHNLGEIPQAVSHFVTTVHPEQLIPAAVLTVAAFGLDRTRRAINKRVH